LKININTFTDIFSISYKNNTYTNSLEIFQGVNYRTIGYNIGDMLARVTVNIS